MNHEREQTGWICRCEEGGGELICIFFGKTKPIECRHSIAEKEWRPFFGEVRNIINLFEKPPSKWEKE